MTWSIHVPAGPCETFRDRATTAIGGNAYMTAADRTQAAAAVDIAAQIVAQHMPGQHDTQYSASLHGHAGGGAATFGVSVGAHPVPSS